MFLCLHCQLGAYYHGGLYSELGARSLGGRSDQATLFELVMKMAAGIKRWGYRDQASER